MKLVLTLCLVLSAAACKTDDAKPAASAGSADSPASQEAPGAKPRSGKINAPPPRLGGGPAEKPGDSIERDERRAAREERRDERRKERMAALDKNADGQLSDDELAEGRKQRAEEQRARADKNGDGKVTVEELSDGRMGRRMDPATLDVNKDGDISADELAAGMQQMREKMRAMREERGSGGRGFGRPPGEDE